MANEAKVISSNPEYATLDNGLHGLVELGQQQATVSAELLCSSYVERTTAQADSSGQFIVFSSDFMRAKETAEILCRTLVNKGLTVSNNGKCQTVPNIRERFFGEKDAGPDSEYGSVWAFDVNDADHTEFNAESVNSVIMRTTAFVKKLDDAHEGKDIVLVAHGDVLQIMQTAFEKRDPRTHRTTVKHLNTGCIREMVLRGGEDEGDGRRVVEDTKNSYDE
jgi:broad specificity phosphatase PhoE